VPAVVEDGLLRVGEHRLRVARMPPGVVAGGKVAISVRPEDVHVRPAGEPGENRLPGTVRFIRDLGASVEVRIDCGGKEVLAVMTPRERPDAGLGDAVAIELPATACVVLPS
jgi:putative spermidine/putrescine transport system ATP-binding protein